MTARSMASWLVRLEIPILSAIYLLFVVTDIVPIWAWAVIAVIWLARWWTTGRLIDRTPFDLPLLVLLALMPVTLAVTTDAATTWPKVNGVLLGIVYFFAVLAQVRTRGDLAWAAFWLVILSAAISLAGLLGTDWAQSKIVSASFIYDRLPHVIQGIPRSIAGGFARNGVGGTLTLVAPLLAGLGFAGKWEDERPPTGRTRWASLDDVWFKRAVWLALAFSLVVLALTQSRGGILGTAVGLVLVAVWRERRVAWLGLVGMVLLLGVLLVGRGNRLAEFVLQMDSPNGTLASRLEVWQRGLMMEQDYAITGIGLGTFNSVAHSIYPFFIAAPDEIVPHAHDNLLEVAVDVGLPGLIAYTSMLAGFALCLLRAFRRTPAGPVKALAVGLGAAMLAHQVFGLTDAFILGTKPGVIVWVYIALAAVMYLRPAELGLAPRSNSR